MSKHIAVLGVAAALAGAALLPGAAAAADLYGYGGDAPPLAFHGRDDVYLDGSRARVVHRDDLRPEPYGERRGPGPVVFDERGADRRYDGPPGDGGWRGPAGRAGWGYGGPGPAGYGYAPPPPPPPYGYGPGPYRPAAVYGAGPSGYGAGPVAYGSEPVGPAFGAPEGGCTTEQARSVTPAGWQKIVTHRTCYRR